jgi:hypothetical protein
MQKRTAWRSPLFAATDCDTSHFSQTGLSQAIPAIPDIPTISKPSFYWLHFRPYAMGP